MDAIAETMRERGDSDGESTPSLRDVFLQLTSAGHTRKAPSWLRDQ